MKEPRYELGRRVKERNLYSGIFCRVGSKPGRIITFLLSDIRDSNGKFICDHLWFNKTISFEKLGRVRQGERIFFHARVSTYRRKNGSLDYKLSYPTQFSKSGKCDGLDNFFSDLEDELNGLFEYNRF